MASKTHSRSNNIKIIIVLGMFSFLGSISGSSTNLALPQMSKDLMVSNGQSTWIVQIGLITSAILLVMWGHLGDLLSKNAIFLYGGVIFVIGSGLTGIAPVFWLVLAGRFIQAIGISMIQANSLGITTDYFSDDHRAEALAVISMFISVGAISGPAIGGFILSIASWRWIFLINVPLMLIVIYIGFRVMPLPQESFASFRHATQGANWFGQNIFTIGMILFFISSPFIQQQSYVIGFILLAVGLALTLFYFYQDDGAKNPWISPEILHNKRYMVSITALMLVMLVNAISNILLPFYFQSYGGISPFFSGLLIMLQSVAMLCTTPIAGVLADKFNREAMTIVGLIVLVVSQVMYASFGRALDYPLIIGAIVLNGIGMAIFLSPNNALTMGLVPKQLTGVAGSFNTFARTFGMTIGISFGSALLFSQLPGVRRISPALGMQFMSAFTNVFWVATALSVLTLVLVVLRFFTSRKRAKIAVKA